MTKSDWGDLGIKKFGDLRILENTVLPNESPLSNTTNASEGALQDNNLENNNVVFIEGLKDVGYKGVIKLVDGYKPPLSCRDHILKDLPSLFVNVTEISQIVADCVLVAESRLQHLPSYITRLTPDEAVALAAYSYDLGFSDSKNNIYFSLNNVLRERNPEKLQQLRPFLTYLMTGLSKLPSVEATVHRGIPVSSVEVVREKYRRGVDIHWSAFTSTTTNIEKAKKFAGVGGIIFRINVLQGRSITHYSTVQSEEEVLLSPNCRLVVISSLKQEGDGFYYLDMVERVGKSVIF